MHGIPRDLHNGAHLDDREALGQRLPARLQRPTRGGRHPIVRLDRGRGDLGRTLRRDAIVRCCDGVEQLAGVLGRPRRLERRLLAALIAVDCTLGLVMLSLTMLRLTRLSLAAVDLGGGARSRSLAEPSIGRH